MKCSMSYLLLVLEDFKCSRLESRGYDTVTDLSLENLSHRDRNIISINVNHRTWVITEITRKSYIFQITESYEWTRGCLNYENESSSIKKTCFDEFLRLTCRQMASTLAVATSTMCEMAAKSPKEHMGSALRALT
jgi:hypothetical protein